MKLHWQNLILQALVVALVIAVMIAPFFSKGPSYQDMADDCVATCNEKNMFGRLVKRDGHYSPKPSAQKFDCVCGI